MKLLFSLEKGKGGQIIKNILFVICVLIPGVFVLFVVSVSGEERNHKNLGAGTAESPYFVPKISSEIKIDADLSEEAWEKALRLEHFYEVINFVGLVRETDVAVGSIGGDDFFTLGGEHGEPGGIAGFAFANFGG